jgi:uncharacterized protein
MTRENLLQQVKEAVQAIEPGAEIILYGSRARGDADRESDWDFLILVDGEVDWRRTDNIRHHLYPIEWEEGEVLSAIVRNRQMWHSFPFRTMPLYQNVAKEGIRL